MAFSISSIDGTCSNEGSDPSLTWTRTIQLMCVPGP
jgi:hypothetical protein